MANQVKAYSRGEEKKSFSFSLFLRNQQDNKVRVRFELTTEDTRYKDFPTEAPIPTGERWRNEKRGT
jgi:hypothetical protein